MWNTLIIHIEVNWYEQYRAIEQASESQASKSSKKFGELVRNTYHE